MVYRDLKAAFEEYVSLNLLDNICIQLDQQDCVFGGKWWIFFLLNHFIRSSKETKQISHCFREFERLRLL